MRPKSRAVREDWPLSEAAGTKRRLRALVATQGVSAGWVTKRDWRVHREHHASPARRVMPPVLMAVGKRQQLVGGRIASTSLQATSPSRVIPGENPAVLFFRIQGSYSSMCS